MSLDLGKSGSYMRSISIGKALPSMHEFLRICEYLGVTPQEFFTGAGDETDRINIFNRLQDLDDGDIQNCRHSLVGWKKSKSAFCPTSFCLPGFFFLWNIFS